MTDALNWLLYIVSVVLLPPLTLGVIRKVKARLQNRIGPPLMQPLYDLLKLYRKGETLSQTASWIFRSSAALNLAVILLISALVPWLSCKPNLRGADLFLVIYLFAMARLFTILAALDSGSAFGAFGASREVTISFLVEPAAILSLAALGAISHTSDLTGIFSFSNLDLSNSPGIWLLVGTALMLASLVELSRMPIDDPTTHLELTMVHEAMILEASGRNLALIQYAQALRMTVLFGFCSQCIMRAISIVWQSSDFVRDVLSIVFIGLIAIALAIFESLAVKLQWRRVPEFIAYSLTMSLLAAFIAVGWGILK